jgi:hypothetical protein
MHHDLATIHMTEMETLLGCEVIHQEEVKMRLALSMLYHQSLSQVREVMEEQSRRREISLEEEMLRDAMFLTHRRRLRFIEGKKTHREGTPSLEETARDSPPYDRMNPRAARRAGEEKIPPKPVSRLAVAPCLEMQIMPSPACTEIHTNQETRSPDRKVRRVEASATASPHPEKCPPSLESSRLSRTTGEDEDRRKKKNRIEIDDLFEKNSRPQRRQQPEPIGRK